ncbi:capsule polysaccharide synthase [Diaporthe eres]|nr:capsule polysaccharide synthase [Diaporthe eres]
MAYKSFYPSHGYVGSMAVNLSSADMLFIFLFIFRYLRFVVHFITGCFLYKPAPLKEKPRYTSRDVAVIVPTVAPYTKEFLKCCETVLANRPIKIVICGVGEKMETYIRDVVELHKFYERYPDTEMIVVNTKKPNKRRQIARASLEIDPAEVPISVNVDDHVYWKPTFLTSLLAAFEDPAVGLVGTSKRVIRTKGGGFWQSYTNFLACTYLCRHNFQIRSEPYLDGGVFVVSSRTFALRTSILRSDRFRGGFTDEHYLFGLRGPINSDDDNYVTRWMLRNEWKVRIQCTPEAEILTPLGDPATFFGKIVSFAAVWDPLLVYTLRRTSFYLESDHRSLLVVLMVGWILASKMVKITAHFIDHPSDVVWLPGYIAFAHWHSFIKLYCLFTFYDHTWSGRNLADLDSVMDREKAKLVA